MTCNFNKNIYNISIITGNTIEKMGAVISLGGYLIGQRLKLDERLLLFCCLNYALMMVLLFSFEEGQKWIYHGKNTRLFLRRLYAC